MADYLPELAMMHEQDTARSRTGGGGGGGTSRSMSGAVAVRGDTPPPGFTRDLGLKLPGIANKVRLRSITLSNVVSLSSLWPPIFFIFIFFFGLRATPKREWIWEKMFFLGVCRDCETLERSTRAARCGRRYPRISPSSSVRERWSATRRRRERRYRANRGTRIRKDARFSPR